MRKESIQGTDCRKEETLHSIVCEVEDTMSILNDTITRLESTLSFILLPEGIDCTAANDATTPCRSPLAQKLINLNVVMLAANGRLRDIIHRAQIA